MNIALETASPICQAFQGVSLRTNNVVSAARVREIVRGSEPVGDERFCLGQALIDSSPTDRVEMALDAKLSWVRFAARFQELTGIHRDRAAHATTLYAPYEEMDEYQEDARRIA
jgi:hypothetical protein